MVSLPESSHRLARINLAKLHSTTRSEPQAAAGLLQGTCFLYLLPFPKCNLQLLSQETAGCPDAHSWPLEDLGPEPGVRTLPVLLWPLWGREVPHTMPTRCS